MQTAAKDGPGRPKDGPGPPQTPDRAGEGIGPHLDALEGLAAQLEAQRWTAGRIAIRCTEEWAAWLGGLSVWCDLPAAEILSQAAYRYAETTGYPGPPPRTTRPRPTQRSAALDLA